MVRLHKVQVTEELLRSSPALKTEYLLSSVPQELTIAAKIITKSTFQK